MAPGLPAMADVERRPGGLRPLPLPLPSAAEESCLSRSEICALLCSPLKRCVLTDAEAESGPGVLLVTGGTMEMLDADEGLAAEEWERCRMVRSAGFRLRSWLLEARWPGVWLRIMGGARSWDSLSSSSSSSRGVGKVRASVGDASWMRWERTTLDLRGERGLSPDRLAESAMSMAARAHVPDAECKAGPRLGAVEAREGGRETAEKGDDGSRNGEEKERTAWRARASKSVLGVDWAAE